MGFLAEGVYKGVLAAAPAGEYRDVCYILGSVVVINFMTRFYNTFKI